MQENKIKSQPYPSSSELRPGQIGIGSLDDVTLSTEDEKITIASNKAETSAISCNLAQMDFVNKVIGVFSG